MVTKKERSQKLMEVIISQSGKSPSAIARAMGISRARLQHWKTGTNSIPTSMLEALQGASGIKKGRFWVLVMEHLG